MGDGGKICYSKALATAGRVAYNASNGRVIYKRAAADNKYATIKIVADDPNVVVDLAWDNIGVRVGTTSNADYRSEGLHSAWKDGVVGYIDYSHPSGNTFIYRMWLSEYSQIQDFPGGRATICMRNTRQGVISNHATVTVTQDGAPELTARYRMTGMPIYKYIIWDSEGKVSDLSPSNTNQ